MRSHWKTSRMLLKKAVNGVNDFTTVQIMIQNTHDTALAEIYSNPENKKTFVVMETEEQVPKRETKTSMIILQVALFTSHMPNAKIRTKIRHMNGKIANRSLFVTYALLNIQ